MTFKSQFKKILSPVELKTLYEHSSAHGRPPSWTAVFCHDVKVKETSKADFTSHRAFSIIEENELGKAWLKTNKHRLLPPTENSEIASMMAEIRCYGALLNAGYIVEPIPTTDKPTPDFKVKYQNRIKPESNTRSFYVEVAVKREDGEESKITEAIANGNLPDGVNRHVYVSGNRKLQQTFRELNPFGKPDRKKPNDSATANAISRICSIKQKETQALVDKPTVIWIDLMDFDHFRGRTFIDQFGTLSTHPHHGGLLSGFIWYAFYGWRGASIFEPQGHRDQRVRMGHDGRFSKKDEPSKYNGAIICIEGCTVFFENPKAEHPLNQNERMMLHGLPNFDINRSVASWYEGGTEDILKHQKKTIKKLASIEIRPAAGHYGPLQSD